MVVVVRREGQTICEWKFCGGKVEDYNTDLLENARREFREEMGAEFDVLEEKPFVMHTVAEKNGEQVDILLVHFLAEFDGDVAAGDDIRDRIYEVVKSIPRGKVMNYGEVAQRAGCKSPRYVGLALHQNPEPGIIPCHRVVNV